MRTKTAIMFLGAVMTSCAARGPERLESGPADQEAARIVLMGVEGSGDSVTYLSDASGSMISTFPTLKLALRRSIDGLSASQRFNLVFFARGGMPAALADAPVAANAANKAKAAALLDEATTGQTDPIPALPVAFAGRPQVCYFVADGDFPDNQAVLAAFRRANAAKATTVHTLAFVGDGGDDVPAAFLAFMRRLAAENGGTFTVVRESELP